MTISDQPENSELLDLLWSEIRELTPGTIENRLGLGERFYALRKLYSDREADVRRTLGHGIFEQEIVKRGYRPRTVREWVSDYEASLTTGYDSAAKRKARRARKSKATEHPLMAFCNILPFKAAKAAYLEAAKILHPDHGGSDKKMQKLNAAWGQAKTFYKECDEFNALVKDVANRTRAHYAGGD
jgi:hypothetical protein